MTLAATALAAVWIAGPAFADSVSAGSTGSGAPPAARAKSKPPRAANPVAGIKADREAASRAAPLDEAAAIEAYGLVGRKRGGGDVRLKPGEDVLKAIRSSLSGGRQGALGGSEGSRALVGADNRVQVRNTTTYPFATAGYLETTNKKGDVWSCSAALVGPSMVLTAGHCLYDHGDPDGWRETVTFWPALNGQDTAPYGGIEFDTEYVLEGFISQYKDSYDDVWPYDVGVVMLAQPVGNEAGWLAYGVRDDLGDFSANMLAYHNDKPAFTMWRSSCDVVAEDETEIDFVHACDAGDGASGAPIYYMDSSLNQRVVVGINIGDLQGGGNWALRITQPMFDWFQSLNEGS